jgi:hypothetical protein
MQRHSRIEFKLYSAHILPALAETLSELINQGDARNAFLNRGLDKGVYI